MKNRDAFLPVSREDLEKRGISQLDFVLVSGDAYVDHPGFGHAVIARVLEHAGYTVGIIAQPRWQDATDFKRLGKPKYAFLVSPGNIDSMVNHYTVNKKIRSEDAYSPGGRAGCRPDRAVIVYCNRIREAYPGIPMIIGGIESSLRRFAHYDYWSNKVRRSVLFDSRADVLIYGMGERQIVQLANALRDGKTLADTDFDGCCYIRKEVNHNTDYVECPSCEEVQEDKKAYAHATRIQYEEQDPVRGKCVVQRHGDRYLVQNKPAMPLDCDELDGVHELPYQRAWHPMYDAEGGVPALNEVKFSITYNRGCYGACAFCALTAHQGRMVTARTAESVVREAVSLTKEDDFKGYIHDIGGPTANFSGLSCDKQKRAGTCKDRQCLYPSPCPNLKVSHRKYLEILRRVRGLPDVKKVFVRSGIRYDYVMADSDDTFLKELTKHHVSGQLRVAPEHVSTRVLDTMKKPAGKVYERFCQRFSAISKQCGKKQYTVPYLMSSHPGSTIHDAIELAVYIKNHHLHPEQVQDFYPTPFTLSTCMFYTGLDPITMEQVYVPKTPEEKQMQRALLQFDKPENYKLVYKALMQAGRQDLIGYAPSCLIRPNHKRRK
ncbi:MAG: YgiQ family radical SAM protein [Ruminococcaceae bacterium]|nr:YgiQ family radical SAM protein [Oscillospiraceae bacterium]